AHVGRLGVAMVKSGTDVSRCLVFGGSGALGGVVCKALASRGGRVAFTYHTGVARATELVPELPDGLAFPLDLTSVPDIERTVDEVAKEFGGIDAFIQCAAVAITVRSEEATVHHRMPQVDEKGWDRMMDVNAKSTFFAVRRVSEIMKSTGGGNIVLIGSIDGVKPVPAPVHYAASKGALRGMTQAMAKELGEHNIRVNLVAPGVLEDGVSRALPENLLKEYIKHCGLRRVGRLSEIAEIVAWIATENTYVTGETILVDGGL
ncbi:MAG: SDR family NAD(P)-dependent oxidoreductase, partial [Planctomycetota bacterium]